MPLRNRIYVVASLLLAATLALMLFALTRPKSAEQVAFSRFVGSSACAPCHASQFQDHKMSRHATTLRDVDKANLGADAPVPGEIPDTNFIIKPSGKGLSLAVKYEPEVEQPLQFALGSGKFALTFIHVMDKDSVVELRESYYPSLHAWKYTPGQDHIDGDGLGRMYSGTLARACIRCHTTAVSPDDLTPEPRFYGVGCESCHGPGRDHVAAMRSGKTSDIRMARLGQLDATRANELCGRCHRTAKQVRPGDTSTQRFQPYGLMKSRCFLESGNSLSCQTCHDPHRNASTDQRRYEKTCLSCHAADAGKAHGPTIGKGKPCPVNKVSGCIPCHMPTRAVSPDVPIAMADHYIRVHRSDGSGEGFDGSFDTMGPSIDDAVAQRRKEFNCQPGNSL